LGTSIYVAELHKGY